MTRRFAILAMAMCMSLVLANSVTRVALAQSQENKMETSDNMKNDKMASQDKMAKKKMHKKDKMAKKKMKNKKMENQDKMEQPQQ